MIVYLLLLICTLSLFQPDKDRTAGMTYAIVCALHFVACESVDGGWYFLSAAAADLLILSILCFRAPVTRLADRLITISMLSGVVNTIGFILWDNNQSIYPYYYSCVTLYVIAALSMLRRDSACDHYNSLYNGFFRALGRPGYALRSALRRQAQT